MMQLKFPKQGPQKSARLGPKTAQKGLALGPDWDELGLQQTGPVVPYPMPKRHTIGAGSGLSRLGPNTLLASG